jgi:anti-sigma factor RsiW
MSDNWTDRLSEYLDGELPEGERAALESHLRGCGDCSSVLAELREVLAEARTLEDHEPAQDLWPAISAQIGVASAPRDIIDLGSGRRSRRQWSFSLPQLAAAGLALMTLSGGSVWLLESSRSSRNNEPPSAATSQMPVVTPISNGGRSATRSYAAAVADLERVLAERQGQLDTTTVRVIQMNLAAIDRAIAQAQKALNADPANMYLNTHLAETMRRKLELLRQAAALVPVS